MKKRKVSESSRWWCCPQYASPWLPPSDFVGVEVDVHNMSPEELVTLQNNFNSLQVLPLPPLVYGETPRLLPPFLVATVHCSHGREGRPA